MPDIGDRPVCPTQSNPTLERSTVQEHIYRGPKLAALTDDLSQTDYIPSGMSSKSRKDHRYRKPPSTLAIYRDQFYEPQVNGTLGEVRSNYADELAPYRRELVSLDVPVDDLDETTPWNV